EEEEAAAAA
ncbi:hypothetical protein CFC21_092572, partial [Triticum aestivum]